MAYLTARHLESILAARPAGTRVPRVFVETGTFRCQTTNLVQAYFPLVHTIELSESLAAHARSLCGAKKVVVHQGDSAKLLPVVLARFREPVVCYLDAHAFWRGAGGDEPAIARQNPMPLWDELRAVRYHPFADWVIVDDLHAFGRAPQPSARGTPEADWQDVTIEKICQTVGSERIVRQEVHGDQLCLWLAPPPLEAAA